MKGQVAGIQLIYGVVVKMNAMFAEKVFLGATINGW